MKINPKLITKYGQSVYSCGLRAGDKLRLAQNLEIYDHLGHKSGLVYTTQEDWTVLSGSSDDKGVLWLLAPDGSRHTWNDDESVFDSFNKQT